MYNKIMLLLTQKADAEPGTLEGLLAEEGQRIQTILPQGAINRRAMHLAEDPTQQIAHAEEAVGAPPAFDAMFEVGAPDAAWGQLLPAVKEIPDRLGSILDLGNSAVIAGAEHIIVPGEEPFTILFVLRRLPDMTLEAFQDYWLNKHADLGRAVPDLKGYKQFHADTGATLEAAGAAGVGISDFDGVAQAFYPTLEDFLAIMAKPEVAQDALEDEKNFIDHTRSSIGVYKMVWNAPV